MTLSNIDSKNQSCHRQTISETSKGSDSELGNECHLGKIAIGECLSINELQSRTGSSPPSQDHFTSPPPPSPHRDYLTLPCRIRHHQRIGTRLRDAFLSARGNQVLIEGGGGNGDGGGGGGNGDGGGGGGGKMALESRTIIDYMSRIVSRYNDRCLLSRGKGFYFIQDENFRATFECSRSDCDLKMTCIICAKIGSIEVVCQNGKEEEEVVVVKHERQ